MNSTNSLTEYEIREIVEGRQKLYASAKLSWHRHSIEKHVWINDEEIISLAKKHNIEDELEYIANCVWGDL
jgi:hypothetical protein